MLLTCQRPLVVSTTTIMMTTLLASMSLLVTSEHARHGRRMARHRLKVARDAVYLDTEADPRNLTQVFADRALFISQTIGEKAGATVLANMRSFVSQQGLLKQDSAAWQGLLKQEPVVPKQNDDLPPPASKKLLFIGVYSAPGEKAALRRQEIRDTYWKHPALAPGGIMEAKFVLGNAPPGSLEEEEIQKEVVAYPNDFVRLPIDEHYEALTNKTMTFFRWFAQHGDAQWLLKLDDDTYPHFGRMLTYLKINQAQYLQMGMLFNCAPVLKETKWAENENLWNHSHFPMYMQGSGYFLTHDLVKDLADKYYYLNKEYILNNEDAAVGVWIERQKSENMSWPIKMLDIPSTLTGCQPQDILSMNNAPGYMRCYWGRYVRGEEDVCCYGPLDNLRQSLLQTGVASTVASGVVLQSQSSSRLYATQLAMLQQQQRFNKQAPGSHCYKGSVFAEPKFQHIL